MQGLNSDKLAIYQTGTGTEWPCLVSTALKNPLQDLKKNLFVLISYEFLAMLEGKPWASLSL